MKRILSIFVSLEFEALFKKVSYHFGNDVFLNGKLRPKFFA
jgi:hypothetical protein